MDDKSCIFFKPSHKCKILVGETCRDAENCCFHKTAEEQAASLAIAYDRLRRLDPAEQQRIADQYYNGKMPWQEGSVCA